MTIQTATPSDLKPRIYDLIEQLSPERLPELLHFLEMLLNGKNTDGMSDPVLSQPPLAQKFPPDQPWLPYVEILANSPDWDEFEEAIAEYRREVDEATGWSEVLKG